MEMASVTSREGLKVRDCSCGYLRYTLYLIGFPFPSAWVVILLFADGIAVVEEEEEDGGRQRRE